MGSGASLPDDDEDENEEHHSQEHTRRRQWRHGQKSVPVVPDETQRGGFIPIDFADKLLRIDGGMGKCHVRVVDMQMQHQVRQFGDPGKSVTGMIAVSEKRLAVRYENDCTVECFDIRKGASVWATRVSDVSKQSQVTRLALLPCGDVVAGTDAGDVARLDKNGKLRGAPINFEGYGGVSCLLVEPDQETVRKVVRGTCVLVGTCTGELAWVGPDGLVRGERQHLGSRIDVLKVVPARTRTVVAVGTHAGVIVRVGMDGVQASPPVELDGSIVSVAFASGGERLLVGTYKGQVAWVDLDGNVSKSLQLFASIVQLAIAPAIPHKAQTRPQAIRSSPTVAVCGTDDGKVVWISTSPALPCHRCCIDPHIMLAAALDDRVSHTHN